MPAYPTPAVLRATAGAPSFAKLTAMLRGGSIAQVLDTVWVPLVSATLIVLVGAIGTYTRQPWLFASLGPTILMVAANPGHETTNFRAIVVGHIAAIACAYLALLMLNATGSASMLATRVVPFPRIWASAAALAMLAIVTPQLKAFHPPAAATALLVTLGAYRMTGKTPLALMGGIVMIALAAEALQRFRPRRGREQAAVDKSLDKKTPRPRVNSRAGGSCFRCIAGTAAVKQVGRGWTKTLSETEKLP